MTTELHWADRRRNDAQGFSLIEILISVVLGLLITVALTTLFARSSRARSDIDNAGQQIENGRYAMQVLRDDVHLAGFYGELGASIPIAWQLPINPCDITILGWNAASLQVPVPLAGLDGTDLVSLGLLNCVPNRKPRTDVLVIRRADTTPLLPAQTVANTPYLQVSLASDLCFPVDTPFTFALGGLAATFSLHQKDCTAISSVRQYLQHIYYVSSCDVCSPSDGIPTLKRVELTAGLSGLMMRTDSVVQGVDDLRVDYGLDTNIDGYPDQWKKCGSAGACTALDFANVVAVKLHVLARQLNTVSGYRDDKVYYAGLAGAIGPEAAASTYNDPSQYTRGNKRHLFSAMVRLVGPSQLRELP